jgi:hypothetical protein
MSPITSAGALPNLDANYREWALANPTLAEKVKPHQAGYTSIQAALATRSAPPATPTVMPPAPPPPQDMTANYRAWALAHPTLAAKVKADQAGYEAIKAALAPPTAP